MGSVARDAIAVPAGDILRPAEAVRPTLPERLSRILPVQRQGWIPANESAEVAGLHIGGLVYLGPAPSRGSDNQPLRGNIDPSLPAATVEADLEGLDLPYWPNYATITPRARATFLQWLASGRADPKIGTGYVFLYFYGLERRFFLEEPRHAEREDLIAEVERLLTVYGENSSIQSYLGRFLDTARAVMGGEPTVSLSPDNRTGVLPLLLQIELSQRLARGEALGPDHVLAWFLHHPETSIRTAMRRVFPEFRTMFGHFFRERCPNGLMIPLPPKKLRPSYQAASGQFTADLSDRFGDVRDLAGQCKPLEIAQALADEACAALDRFSRLVGKDEEARGTLAAHLALPPRIRAEFPNAQAEEVKYWADLVIEAGGLVLPDEIFERLGETISDRPGKRDYVQANEALASIGVGLAPDAALGIRRPKPDEPVVLYRLPDAGKSLEISGPAHDVVQISILLGSFVAHADGGVLEHERAALAALIEGAPGLSATERAHLHATLNWALAVPSNMSLLRRRMKEASLDARGELGRLAMVVAAVDGRLDPGEIAAVERLYKALGLDASGIYAQLHSLVGSDEPVTVREADTGGGGHAIPAPPSANESEPKPRLQLDRDRISAVMADTAHVSSILGKIFAEEVVSAHAMDVTLTPTHEPDEPQGFEGLDPFLGPFLTELLGRNRWSEDDFVALVASHRLMPGGAVEALNEWAFECFDAALIDEHEGFEVDQDLARRLRS